MSTRILFKPIGSALNDGWGIPLKTILLQKFGDGGSLYPQTRLDHSHLPFLEGLKMAGEPDLRHQAQELMDAIVQYDVIEIWSE